jgi:hypothetical protein
MALKRLLAMLKNQSEFVQMAYTGGENAGGVVNVGDMGAWDALGLARS